MLSTSILICLTSETDRQTETSRAWDDVTRAWRHWPSFWDNDTPSNKPTWKMTLPGCSVGCYVLSLEPRGRWCPFLQVILYDRNNPAHKKSSTATWYLSCEKISWFPREQSGYHGNGPCELFTVTDPGLPAEFGARRSINRGVVSGQTRPQTLLKL